MLYVLQVVSALHYLQTELKVMHRDVKPSNILISRSGAVKICDFGISGHLVDSVAKTIDAGCKPYMAVSSFTAFFLLKVYAFIVLFSSNFEICIQHHGKWILLYGS